MDERAARERLFVFVLDQVKVSEEKQRMTTQWMDFEKKEKPDMTQRADKDWWKYKER